MQSALFVLLTTFSFKYCSASSIDLSDMFINSMLVSGKPLARVLTFSGAGSSSMSVNFEKMTL
jgi:hypothetical protein